MQVKRTAERRQERTGISLLEVTIAVTILGILAVIVIPRFSAPSANAKRQGCSANKGNIEVQCQLWLRQKNSAPNSNLANIGADANYFPEGLPVCPVDGTSYTINTTTLFVSGHAH